MPIFEQVDWLVTPVRHRQHCYHMDAGGFLFFEQLDTFFHVATLAGARC
jgi:hypothetical protein